MSKSGLYAHFGSKEELQLATIASARERFIAEVFDRARAAVRRRVPRPRTLDERLGVHADIVELGPATDQMSSVIRSCTPSSDLPKIS